MLSLLLVFYIAAPGEVGDGCYGTWQRLVVVAVVVYLVRVGLVVFV